MMTSYQRQAHLDHRNTQESGQRDRSAIIMTYKILFMSISNRYEQEHKLFMSWLSLLKAFANVFIDVDQLVTS